MKSRFTEGNWIQSDDNYNILERRLILGKPDSVIQIIQKSIQLFRSMDTNKRGELSISLLSSYINSLSIPPASYQSILDSFVRLRQGQMWTYLEFLASFGNVLEQQVVHSLHSSIAVLKYCNPQNRVNEALSSLYSLCKSLSSNPDDPIQLSIRKTSPVYWITEIEGGKILLQSLGYVEENGIMVLDKKETPQYWSHFCYELENELAELEGNISVAAALRRVRENGIPITLLSDALQILLKIIENILENPKDYKKWSIPQINPIIQKKLNFEGATILLNCIGFYPKVYQNKTLFVLIGTDKFLPPNVTGQVKDTLKTFKFPELDADLLNKLFIRKVKEMN